MKTLIILVVGLLSVGCLTPEQKQKALRDSVVGEYIAGDGKIILGDDGEYGMYYFKGPPYGVWKLSSAYKWKLVNGEIHVFEDSAAWRTVSRINKDGNITFAVAHIDKDGIRRDLFIAGDALLGRGHSTYIKVK